MSEVPVAFYAGDKQTYRSKGCMPAWYEQSALANVLWALTPAVEGLGLEAATTLPALMLSLYSATESRRGTQLCSFLL